MLAEPLITQTGALRAIESTESFRARLERRCAALFESIVGMLAMLASLAVISAIPVLNLLSLGYFLNASARVAESGRLRDGFIALPSFARLGSIMIGLWLWSLPIMLVHSLWRDAELIQAGSEKADGLRNLLAFLIVVIGMHLIGALLRGGNLRHLLFPAPLRWFRWITGAESFPRPAFPFLKPSFFKELWTTLKLGFFGFLGGAIWLFIPLTVLFLASLSQRDGVALLGSLLGVVLLGIVVLILPFLQTRYAHTRTFSDFFAVRAVRSLFRKAPFAFFLALSLTLLLALPLYLLKIELTPREVAWLPNLFFVLFMFPARLALGRALFAAEKAEAPRKWPSRWISGIASIPVVAAYLFIVWLSQYLSWYGSWSLLEQHAFLVPAPLFGI